MKKLSNLPDDERRTLSDEIDSLGNQYPIAGYDTAFGGFKIEMGLCTNCCQLLFSKSQYGTIYARCEKWEKQLNGVDLIQECTGFARRGEMSLWDMKQIAVLIDVEKRKIGIV